MSYSKEGFRDKRGIGSLEYSVLVAFAIAGVSFMGVGVARGISSALQQSVLNQSSTQVLHSAATTAVPRSEPCLHGAHGKSTICPGVTSKFN